jgi:preprotein translocase subunit SecD
MRRSGRLSLLFVVVLAFGLLGGTLAAGNKPELGLDLQGGASVVLQPTRQVSSSILDQSIEIIRSRVDALGVAEPDISRQGSSIIVQLPGVRDQDRALQIVGQTAQLRFRPVLNVLPAEDTPASTTTTVQATTTTTAATTTTVAGATTTTVPATTTSTTISATATTPRSQDRANAIVVLPEEEDGRVVRRYRLGPTEMSGRAVRTARAVPPQAAEGWSVEVEFTGAGATEFDELAKRFFNQQVAIVLDGVVKSAPQITSQDFNGRATISGGSGGFGERESKNLALVLRYGALPVTLEQQTVQKVSASLGRDSLNAGVIAGAVGLGLVLLYMLFYYRALGVVVIMGLVISAMLLWSVVAFLGETSGLALSLAGATGIIISVGVTVDSYIVYFERLKDEIRSGKTLRSSVDRGFSRAYRTILAADISSLIGAGLLYWLTVGPVRGFAFFLGLSTLLDLFVSYFFTRPMVATLGRSRLFTEARGFGVARGLAVRTGDSA